MAVGPVHSECDRFTAEKSRPGGGVVSVLVVTLFR